MKSAAVSSPAAGRGARFCSPPGRPTRKGAYNLNHPSYAEAVRLYQSGMTLAEVAHALNLSWSRIQYWIKAAGVTRSSKNSRWGAGHVGRKQRAALRRTQPAEVVRPTSNPHDLVIKLSWTEIRIPYQRPQYDLHVRVR